MTIGTHYLKPIRKVLIVGSGIAGQTLACALARRDIVCEVVELKADWHIIGGGMYMQSNALRALADIDVVEEIVAQGWHAEDDISHIADSQGHLLAAVHLPRIAGPDVPAVNPIQRYTLHNILRSAVERAGVSVRMGLTADRIEDESDDGGVVVDLSDGSSGHYDLVVGADGIHSRVRDLVFGGQAVYSGFSNWRVILPRPGWLVRPTWLMGRGKSFGFIPIARDHCYIAGVSKEPGNPWFEPTTLLDLMRERFAAFGGAVPEFLAAIPSAEQVVYTPIEEVLLALPWHKGRVVVLGDAAHASTPFWAQGASMAIEDAILLARLLEQGRPLVDIFAEWTARRHPRCLYVQHGSLATGCRSHDETDGAYERLLGYLQRHAAADIRQRYETLAEPI